MNFNPRTPCDSRLCGTNIRVNQISIHAPLAGCDREQHRRSRSPRENFNPRTPCGVRPQRGSRHKAQRDFNPRTPCGVRRIVVTICIKIYHISIHAPLAGCDKSPEHGWMCKRNFNPRTPCGVRPLPSLRTRRTALFQSTHPLRGATSARLDRRP